ncbi:MAG: hypothetical protein QXL96_11035 [Ignisphaera sp.]
MVGGSNPPPGASPLCRFSMMRLERDDIVINSRRSEIMYKTSLHYIITWCKPNIVVLHYGVAMAKLNYENIMGNSIDFYLRLV